MSIVNKIPVTFAKIPGRLESYIKANKIKAFRLAVPAIFDSQLAVDIYMDNAVIQVFDAGATAYLQDIEKSLSERFGITECFYKNRTGIHDLPLPGGLHKEITVEEYGCRFLINLSDYLDTGLFLDHRETRKWIGTLSKGKIVLNTFAYTGSFSVYAGLNGAAKTYSVDLSKTYCEWIKKNLALNGLSEEKNWVYKMDTMEFFAYAGRKGLKFDIIIIDPPTFSKNKGKHFSVRADHPKLLNAALALLAPGGFILFSNNCKEFSLNRKALAPCKVEEKKDTYPPDFAGSFPHKCYIIRN